MRRVLKRYKRGRQHTLAFLYRRRSPPELGYRGECPTCRPLPVLSLSLSIWGGNALRDVAASKTAYRCIVRGGQGNITIYSPCSADHEQDWQPYPVEPYSGSMYGHTIQNQTKHTPYNKNAPYSSLFWKSQRPWWSRAVTNVHSHGAYRRRYTRHTRQQYAKESINIIGPNVTCKLW